jgi:hypothetical protein
LAKILAKIYQLPQARQDTVAMADYTTSNRMVKIDLALLNYNIIGTKLPLIKFGQAGMVCKTCKTSRDRSSIT